jgi:hypothetical protein
VNGLINFQKKRKIANIIQNFKDYQNFDYIYQPIEEMDEIFEKIEIVDEKILYKLSLANEMREDKNMKIIDMNKKN